MWLRGSEIFFFSQYLINDTISKEKIIEHKMIILIFSTSSAIKISHSRKEMSHIESKVYLRHSYKVPVNLFRFHETSIFWTDFIKIKIKFYENPSGRSELIRADRNKNRQT